MAGGIVGEKERKRNTLTVKIDNRFNTRVKGSKGVRSDSSTLCVETYLLLSPASERRNP
jgi:hypothetical protein